MNHAYRLVWNCSRRAFLAVPEFARRARGSRSLMGLILATLSCGVYALPTGSQVVSGTVAINQTGNVLTVTNSANAIVNWQKFGIDANETVRFVQPFPSSAVLNRVVTANPSLIYGTLSSNGKVWLINPNGIMIGPGGQVNTAGFVASTLDVSNANFVAGRLTFNSTPGAGSVVNQGSIITPSGGSVYLVGANVSNEGIITTPQGETILAAGETVSLIDTGTPGVSVAITGAAGNTTNLGQIVADAGRIGMAGVLVKNAGTLNASSVVTDGGRIFLKASQNVTLTEGSIIEANGAKGGSVSIRTEDDSGQIAGTLTARGVISTLGNGSAGSGGSVETSAAKVDLNNLSVNANEGTWLIDPADFTIAASGGDISGTALAGQLNTTNVTIRSSNGATPGVGDISVNDPIAWNSAHGLTLSALHGVNVNQPISNAGSGGVTLRADNGGACVAGASNCGTVTFTDPGHITLNGGALNIYYNPVGSNNAADTNGNGPSYAMPTDYSGNVTLNGGSTLTAWMLVNDVNQLQAISTNLGGNYALGKDIEAAATSGWNPNTNGAFVPIGSTGTPFSGIFDGLGHTIADLKVSSAVSDPNSFPATGLFANSSGTLTNVGLVNVDASGFRQETGALVGFNTGVVSNAYATGNVGSRSYSSSGGLVGYNGGTIIKSYAAVQVYGLTGAGGLVDKNAGTISASYATGSVNSQEDGALSGGLVSYNTGTITNAYATGAVIAYQTAGGLVGGNLGTISNSHAEGNVLAYRGPAGGLAGYNSGMIQDAYATGDVTGSRNSNGGLVGSNSGLLSRVYATGAVIGNSFGGGSSNSGGGLVAYNSGTIDHAYATGAVTGADSNGGLVAFNAGVIKHAKATGRVSGTDDNGGLVADNTGTIADSSSSSNVTGGSNIGGLVGYNIGTIDSSYATGKVTGDDYLGGLVGANYGTVVTSYATGKVSSSHGSYVGGLVGENGATIYSAGTIANSYATGAVSGMADVGGLVGANLQGATISTSYSVGRVTGTSLVGGLVGSNNGTVINSYWDIKTSGQTTSAGGTGLTDKQMKQQSSFVGFDFQNVWIDQGRYLRLRTFLNSSGQADDAM